MKRVVLPLVLASAGVVALLAQGNPDAAKITNPVAATPESIAAGKATYTRYCANCHATNGEGSPGNDLTPPAPGLTKDLKHGSTDGEIFSTIKNGVPPDFNMAAWGMNGLNDADIWNVVNYIRTLQKK